MNISQETVDRLIQEILHKEEIITDLKAQVSKLWKHIESMSCCCSGCQKHNQDLKENDNENLSEF